MNFEYMCSYTRLIVVYDIDTIDSPDDEHEVARNM